NHVSLRWLQIVGRRCHDAVSADLVSVDGNIDGETGRCVIPADENWDATTCLFYNDFDDPFALLLRHCVTLAVTARSYESPIASGQPRFDQAIGVCGEPLFVEFKTPLLKGRHECDAWSDE